MSKGIKKGKKEGVVSFDSESEEVFKEPKRNFYKERKRNFTISIVVPSSIIDNA